MTEVHEAAPALVQRWKRIVLGGAPNPNTLIDDLQEKGFAPTSCARTMVYNRAFTIDGTIRQLDLVVLSPKQLGITSGERLGAIYRRARECDFRLCPAEVGPQLRLQYADQPVFESLRIAMHPIVQSQTEEAFALGNDGQRLWLDCCVGSARYFIFSPDARFVFCL